MNGVRQPLPSMCIKPRGTPAVVRQSSLCTNILCVCRFPRAVTAFIEISSPPPAYINIPDAPSACLFSLRLEQLTVLSLPYQLIAGYRCNYSTIIVQSIHHDTRALCLWSHPLTAPQITSAAAPVPKSTTSVFTLSRPGCTYPSCSGLLRSGLFY